MTPFREGKLGSVKTILNADPAALYQLDDSKRFNTLMPLNVAAMLGKIEIMQFLIDLGADVNKVGEHRFATALQAAVFFDKKEAVKLLLKSGAEINRVLKMDWELRSPLSDARTKEMAALLIEAGAWTWRATQSMQPR